MLYHDAHHCDLKGQRALVRVDPAASFSRPSLPHALAPASPARPKVVTLQLLQSGFRRWQASRRALLEGYALPAHATTADVDPHRTPYGITGGTSAGSSIELAWERRGPLAARFVLISYHF